MHPASEVASVSDGLVSACSLLCEDLNEDLHGADEDWSQRLDLLQVLGQPLPLQGVEKVSLSTLDVLIDFRETRAEILDELDQVLHGLDDLGDGEIVENLLTIPADLTDLRGVK